jgi:hypothetical protein
MKQKAVTDSGIPESVSVCRRFGCKKGTNLIILERYQRVLAAADGPLADAPEGGAVHCNFRALS